MKWVEENYFLFLSLGFSNIMASIKLTIVNNDCEKLIGNVGILISNHVVT